MVYEPRLYFHIDHQVERISSATASLHRGTVPLKGLTERIAELLHLQTAALLREPRVWYWRRERGIGSQNGLRQGAGVRDGKAGRGGESEQATLRGSRILGSRRYQGVRQGKEWGKPASREGNRCRYGLDSRAVLCTLKGRSCLSLCKRAAEAAFRRSFT